jgi:hypothetical protein
MGKMTGLFLCWLYHLYLFFAETIYILETNMKKRSPMFPKTLVALAAFALVANVSAKNAITNGDMEYGDGGWYLWNNPAGPAEVTSKIGEPGIGFDGSQGAVVSIQSKPADWWGLQLQPPKFLADTIFYELSFKAKAEKGGAINAVVQGGLPDYRQKTSASFVLTPEWKTYKMKFFADQKGYGVNNVVFQLGFITCKVYFDDVSVEPVGEGFDVNWYKNSAARIDSIRKQNLTVEGFASQEEFCLIAFGANRMELRQRLFAQEERVDVVSARENKAVEGVEK